MCVALRESDKTAQIGLLRLLSRIYLKEVDREFASFLSDSNCLEVFGMKSSDFSTWSQELEEELAVEFCRLFITPGVCVPLASAFLGAAEGDSKAKESTVALLIPGILEQVGVSLEAEFAELPQDHLSLLFSLWALFLAEGAGGDDFKKICLDPWVMAFADRLYEKAQHPFYQGLAQVTKESLQNHE